MPSPTSPNMGLFLPVPSTTPGPQWASELVSNESAIDLHDHTSGKGVRIPLSALTVNANLSFANFALTALGYLNLTQLASTGAMTVNETLANVLGRPYWRDNTGVVKQITLAGDALSLASGTTLAGFLATTAIAAPATPAAGLGRIYVDSTSKNLAVKDDAGSVNHGVRTRTVTANNWIQAIADDGTTTIAQPAFSSISGTLGIGAGGTGQITAVAGLDALRPTSSNIASAATTDLATATGETVTITGTATITALGTVAAGAIRRLLFPTVGGTLTHNATSLICPQGVSIQWKGGDIIEVLSLGAGNWRVTDVQSSGIGIISSGVSGDGLYAAGTNVLQFGSTFLLPLVAVRSSSGAAGTPSLCFSSDITSGIFLNAAGDVGVAATGVQQFHTTTSGLLHSTRHQLKQGAAIASAASITLGNDGSVFSITGTTGIQTISSTNWQAGSRVTLIFASAIAANFPTGGNITTRAGLASTATTANSAWDLTWDGTAWRVLG